MSIVAANSGIRQTALRAAANASVLFEKTIEAETQNASFRGGLLRLMMAGLLLNSSFWMNYIVSEIVNLLLIAGKEGLRMVIRVAIHKARKAKSFAKRFAKISSWGTCLLYRPSLLMSQ